MPAGAVVVGAGTYGSPEVLLRSGIGPDRELAALGIEVVHHLPGVGRNLHDQPAVHLEFAATHELAEQLAAFTKAHWLPAEQAIAKISAGHTDGPYDLHVYPWIDPDPELDTGRRCVIPAALLTPRSRGILRLGGADPAVRPRIDHGFLSDPDGADLEALVAGVEWIERVITERPLAGFLGEALVAPPAPGDPSNAPHLDPEHASSLLAPGRYVPHGTTG